MDMLLVVSCEVVVMLIRGVQTGRWNIEVSP